MQQLASIEKMPNISFTENATVFDTKLTPCVLAKKKYGTLTNIATISMRTASHLVIERDGIDEVSEHFAAEVHDRARPQSVREHSRAQKRPRTNTVPDEISRDVRAKLVRHKFVSANEFGQPDHALIHTFLSLAMLGEVAQSFAPNENSSQDSVVAGEGEENMHTLGQSGHPDDFPGKSYDERTPRD